MKITPDPLPDPLEGVRVLDLSRVLAGPYCTMMLGDLGADVVKVESPDGDDTRRWGPPYLGTESAYYLCCNRNKRGLVLDFALPEARQLARALALKCDVLVENFQIGKMEEWGLGYEELSAENPGIIYCSISGYGRTGPDRSLPGYDYVIQAAGGVMSITGEKDGPPVKVGVAIVDLTTGMFAATAIMAALRVRDMTGRGQRIDMALFDSHLAWLANVGSNYLVSGQVPARYGNGHANIVPYDAFGTSDGWIVVAVGNDRQFERLCEAIAMPGMLADPRFATNPDRVRNREALCDRLSAIFAEQSSAHWLGILQAHEVPSGPVNSVDRALESPQAASRGMVEQVEHPGFGPFRMVASPLKLESTPPAIRRHPPMLGEHTGDVLAEWLGTGADEMAGLRGQGVFG